MLSDVEMDESYRLSIEEMVNDSLEELSEKGLLEISIDDNGEILYGLSEEGKAYTKDITDNDNDN
jgi:DNA-binding PadR family transcriptional regulator